MKKLVYLILLSIPLWCVSAIKAVCVYPSTAVIDSMISANEFVGMDSICKEIATLDSSLRNNEYEMSMIYRAIDSLSSDILTVFYYNKIGLCNRDTTLLTPLEYLCSKPLDERSKKGKVDSITSEKIHRKLDRILGVTESYNVELGKKWDIVYKWLGPFKITSLK